MSWHGFRQLGVNPDTVKASVRLEDVISTVLDRRLIDTGAELLCQCWSHGPDRHPSCRIDATKQVFFCDVCGRGGDVFTFLRDRHRCSFTEAVRWLATHRERIRRARTDAAPRSTVARKRQPSSLQATGPRAVYPYFDAEWNLLFQKIRTPAKQFFYRRPNPGGGWVWNLEGITPVLYRLPMLRGLPYVYVVEGEKDADALWEIELPATTNPEGAGHGKWKHRYARQLLDAGVRRVIVIPDNDVVGRQHGSEISASCRRAGLRTTELRLPGLPLHGDVSDWLALGNTRRDLRALARRLRAD